MELLFALHGLKAQCTAPVFATPSFMLQSRASPGATACPQLWRDHCLHPSTGLVGDQGMDGATVPDAIAESDSLQTHGLDIPKQEHQSIPIAFHCLSPSSNWLPFVSTPPHGAHWVFGHNLQLIPVTLGTSTVTLLSAGDAQPKPGRSAQCKYCF